MPGLDWTVHQLARHLASFPDGYRHLAAQAEPLLRTNERNDDDFMNRPDRLEKSLAELADDIESEFDAWLAELGDDGSAPRISWVLHTVHDTGAAALSELLVHRRDLAPLTGVGEFITADQARTILDTIFAMSASFVNPDVAARCAGTFHLDIRGGSDWTIEVEDGAATVTRGRPERADVRFSNEPVAMLLVSLGRVPIWKAALTGNVVVWGRRPWLALRFATLFDAP